MRVDRLRFAGFGPFDNEVAIDFAGMDGPLIAVTGENGAGKSTLLQLIGGAVYRTTQTRGKLHELATSRSAYVEVHVATDRELRITQKVDAKTGHGEAHLLDGQGVPILEGVDRNKFDAWVEAHMQPRSVYDASLALSRAGSFATQPKAGRVEILVSVLGLEKIDAMAALAGVRAADLRRQVDTITAKIDQVAGGDVAALSTQLTAAETTRAHWVTQVQIAADALGEATLLEQTRGARQREIEAWQKDRHATILALGEATTTKLGLLGRLATCRAVLTQQDEIADAVTQCDAIRRSLEEHAGAAITEETAAALAQAEHRAADTEARAALSRAGAARAREGRCAALLHDRTYVELAVAAIPAMHARWSIAADRHRATVTELAQLGTARHDVAQRRIGHLRGGLEVITGGLLAAEVYARAVLTTDERMAEPDDAIAALTLALPGARDELAAASEALQNAKTVASREAEIGRAAADRAIYAVEVETEERHAAAALGRAEEALGRYTAAGLRRAEHAQRAAIARARLVDVEGLAALAPQLRDAETRIAELLPQVEAATAQEGALQARLAGDAAPEPLGEPPNMTALRSAVATAEQHRDEATHAAARLGVQLDAARAGAARVAELQAERAPLDVLLADERHIIDDLAALKALEIDVAGPELSALTNDLLHTCYGPRFSASIETTRQRKNGPGEIEDCIVRVFDSQSGRSLPIERLSEGEGAIVGEAIADALMVVGCRRARIVGATLIRDEATGVLSESNKPVYVAMLRRAAGMTSARHVLFVSQDRAIQKLADQRLWVHDGTVEVA